LKPRPKAAAVTVTHACDGSPVALYARMEPLGEPELIHAAVPPGAEILELGCGAGRLTHRLIELGHPVVAVDASPEMLDHVRGAETIEADITTLDLGRRFPVVVLAGNFVNHPDREGREEFLRACARHVRREGQVLIQRFPPDWEPTVGWREAGGIRLRLRDHKWDGGLISGVMEYVVDGETLEHEFTSRVLRDEELDQDLAAAGLGRDRTLDERGGWVVAVLV
jgi:SAM-dependent methyltransferase